MSQTINDDAVGALAEALRQFNENYADDAPIEAAAPELDAAYILDHLPKGWHLTNQPTADSAQEIERPDFDAIAQRAKARVHAAHADRYVDLWTVVEIADQWVEQDFEDEVVYVRRADWNRIVAVARGHMSKAARQAIDRYREASFDKAVKS